MTHLPHSAGADGSKNFVKPKTHAACKRHCVCYFEYPGQLKINVIGAVLASSVVTLMRHRPSDATSYCQPAASSAPPPTIGGLKSPTGAPTCIASSITVMRAAISA